MKDFLFCPLKDLSFNFGLFKFGFKSTKFQIWIQKYKISNLDSKVQNFKFQCSSYIVTFVFC
jgi:hypothetical protein